MIAESAKAEPRLDDFSPCHTHWQRRTNVWHEVTRRRQPALVTSAGRYRGPLYGAYERRSSRKRAITMHKGTDSVSVSPRRASHENQNSCAGRCAGNARVCRLSRDDQHWVKRRDNVESHYCCEYSDACRCPILPILHLQYRPRGTGQLHKHGHFLTSSIRWFCRVLDGLRIHGGCGWGAQCLPSM